MITDSSTHSGLSLTVRLMSTGFEMWFSICCRRGAQTGTLLPGESGLVTLTLTNPNSNVKARLLSIAPGEVFVDTVGNPDDATYCHGQIELSTAGADLLMPTLAVSEANFPFALRNAVKLKDDTDIRCQAMTFHTTWTAQFQAVR